LALGPTDNLAQLRSSVTLLDDSWNAVGEALNTHVLHTTMSAHVEVTRVSEADMHQSTETSMPQLPQLIYVSAPAEGTPKAVHASGKDAHVNGARV